MPNTTDSETFLEMLREGEAKDQYKRYDHGDLKEIMQRLESVSYETAWVDSYRAIMHDSIIDRLDDYNTIQRKMKKIIAYAKQVAHIASCLQDDILFDHVELENRTK